VRYVAYEEGDEQLIGVLVGASEVAPLGSLDGFYGDLRASVSRAEALAIRVGAEEASLGRLALETLRQVPPVPASARVLCLGLNYRAHSEEASQDLPSSPTLFLRAKSTLCCDGDEVRIPRADAKLDWEGELAAVVGTTLEDATEEEAARAVFAYTCFDDLSARELQFSSSQWTLGKNADGTGPMGPVLVGVEEIPDPYSLHIETRVNGAVMQSASTGEMIFRIAPVLSYVSKVMRLMPGDVLVTGTPEGVGYIRNPPVYLKPGDLVEVEIERIGILANRIVGPAST
jgi:2,4-diketo-3-deoxy-L-fuconate hydrolase